MSRATQAVINLSQLKDNYLFANQCAPKSKNMAIIKADAYGHGLIEVAQALAAEAPAFGVAIIDEAINLREAGIDRPILILQGVITKQELCYASENNLWIVIHDLSQLNTLLENPQKQPLNVWLKIETGMNRLGINESEFHYALNKLKSCSWVGDDIVLSSHFSCADELENAQTEQQFERFNKLINESAKKHSLSAANSSALVRSLDYCLDWNRPGILLYGLPLFDQVHSSDESLKAVMTFESSISSLREIQKGEAVGYGRKWIAQRKTIVATVGVGYADGYPRQAKNGTPVFIKGKIALLVGTVSMDLITIDVTDISDVKIGDVVELWGENICANTVAKSAGTIGYDLVAGVTARVPRVYQS